jgi:precorrin-3B C17-methyltransferase
MSKLYVVGIGPGEECYLTERAKAVLEEAELFCGYTLYLELLKPLYPDKPVWGTGMTGEIERCRCSLERAAEGKTVALVCSGDAGVYGMAAPVLELAPAYPNVRIEIIPGITAALSGSALLGAPLGHDFAVISLSDLLTPWEQIAKRLEMAAKADFCIALYNPASRQRRDHLSRACGVLLDYLSPETVCGAARMIARADQEITLMTLRELRDYRADMFTTVFVGNSRTKIVDGRMGSFYERVCLTEQKYVKEDSITVGQYTAQVAKALGADIKVVSFVLYEKGEGLEKREDNFAEEIAQLTGQAK